MFFFLLENLTMAEKVNYQPLPPQGPPPPGMNIPPPYTPVDPPPAYTTGPYIAGEGKTVSL